MAYFWGAVLLIIAVLAIIDIVNSTKYSVRIGNKNAGVFYFLESSGEDKALEFIIRETIKKYKWGSDISSLNIVVIDNGMSKQTLDMCEKMLREFDFISVCKKERLADFITARVESNKIQ